MYPFAFVLRMRVTQIVCGIATLLMGSVALIEEKSHFNMGMGIPAGISTVLAAANSIYCSRGFDGYQPPSCKTQPWTKLRFLGPTVRIAGIHIVLWGLATGLLITVSINAIRILLTGQTSSTISVLAAIECILAIAIVTALLAVVWIDLRYNPD
ncbi:UNVERIFIED_CONTAM: hypothetical protein PYX00_003312 [Menopon gallinae]|uniref:Uncharacterized protein n=1 Tax=Menopon gallinae TaxID=328185 RepID=A0AAW2I0P6_9NEOP